MIQERGCDSIKLKSIAERFLAKIDKPSVALLYGKMGVGKTQFVQWCLSGAQVASPTFALHHEYGFQGRVVHHLDLYRLNSASEFENTGLADIFVEPSGLIFVEWPERLDLKFIPSEWQVFEIAISFADGSQNQLRDILISQVAR